MTIQLTPEGSIVIDGVKVGEWNSSTSLNDIHYKVRYKQGLKVSSAKDEFNLKNIILVDIINGFKPKKWEE